MKQISFSEAEFSGKKRVTRRERFLSEIERVLPWQKLLDVIAPYYIKDGKTGRPAIPLERLLRMCLVQHCFALSDEGTEDALYDSQSIRDFVGLDFAREKAPDTTTLLHFRHLLEKHNLTEGLFAAINAHLAEKGLILREGTIVDATLIAAPSSTKNKDRQRAPEMHQTKKGNQWHFGMKAHIGVDASSGIIHTVVTTPANAHDVTQAGHLLHGKEKWMLGDAGYPTPILTTEEEGMLNY
ncbi:IS5 family transposase [Citrobacter gillenii]|nr:IS5 family transposase [Citrobacter sp. C1]RFU89094.1 IS5 family transposase [Citrobacter gillenii]